MKRLTEQQINRAYCPIAKAMGELGDRWILLILRECFLKAKRFDDFQQNLGVSKSVLSSKLQRMIELQLLEKEAYKEIGARVRYEYKLTKKGRDLLPVILTLLEWGNQYLIPEGTATVVVVDKEHEEPVHLQARNTAGDLLKWKDMCVRLRQKTTTPKE